MEQQVNKIHIFSDDLEKPSKIISSY